MSWGGTFVGGFIGGSVGWLIGSLTLRYHSDKTVRAAYLAGEWVSEDTVPRGALAFFGGLLGCVLGFMSGLGMLVDMRRRNIGGSAKDQVSSPMMLFD